MGSVPNCQKEIAARHAIRWFKCKLKPPKNDVSIDKSASAEDPVLSPIHNNADVVVFWMNVHNANKSFLVSVIFSTKYPNASLPLTISHTIIDMNTCW